MKTIKFSLPIILVLLSTTVCFCQTEEADQYPIDTELEKCNSEDTNQTTNGMMNCEAVARDAWEKEMNKFLKLLSDTLTGAELFKLQESQNNWVKYKNAEFDFSSSFYYGLQGSIWKIAAVSRQSELFRQRALEFQMYYDALKQE